MILLALLGYFILVLYEFIPLFKQKLWLDFGVNAALGLLSFTIAILLCLNVKLPSPVKPIRGLITAIFGK
ncbi:MAG TPA: hypothetical protein VHP38_06910 [Ruminiclostridium sp.]|nr:hypothetical protein [Ruminiclostridium sp.]